MYETGIYLQCKWQNAKKWNKAGYVRPNIPYESVLMVAYLRAMVEMKPIFSRGMKQVIVMWQKLVVNTYEYVKAEIIHEQFHTSS